MRPDCRSGRRDKALSVGQRGALQQVYKLAFDGDIGDEKEVDFGAVLCVGGSEIHVFGYDLIFEDGLAVAFEMPGGFYFVRPEVDDIGQFMVDIISYLVGILRIASEEFIHVPVLFDGDVELHGMRV